VGAAVVAEDVDGEPGRGTDGEEAGDDDAAVPVNRDFLHFHAAAAEMALEVRDGLAEAQAADEVEAGVAEGARAAGEGDAVDGGGLGDGGGGCRADGGDGGGGEEGGAHERTIAQRCCVGPMRWLCMVAMVAVVGCKEEKRSAAMLGQ
jgi:hypothetical protein